MSTASAPFQWVDSCCPSSDPDLFSPLSSGAAYLGKGEGDEKTGPDGTPRPLNTDRGKDLHLASSFCFSGSMSHMDRSFT